MAEEPREAASPGPIREPAPAKLNLFLRVEGRREDGFHDIESVILPVTLADGVQALPGDGLTLALAGEYAEAVPVGEDNLALRAARALAAETGKEARARLLLAKNIPVAAGLGGGSADAAAALRALNDLWECGVDRAGLAEIGASVGSDVPALVPGAPVLARGRGERVEPVAVPRTWWVLVLLPFGVTAAEAYRWWDEDGGRSGSSPDDVLSAAADPEKLAGAVFDDLEGPVSARHPEIGEARERLLGAGALAALMCGSGPTVAGLCRDGAHAEDVSSKVGGIVVTSVSGPPTGR